MRSRRPPSERQRPGRTPSWSGAGSIPTSRRTHVRERVVEEARAALAHDGAQAIYVNGMSMLPAAIGAEELSGLIGAPVLDPLRIGMQTAEMVAAISGRGRAP